METKGRKVWPSGAKHFRSVVAPRILICLRRQRVVSVGVIDPLTSLEPPEYESWLRDESAE
jgi:hypothetical protein